MVVLGYYQKQTVSIIMRLYTYLMIKFVNLYGILFYNGYFFDSDLFLKKENQNKIEISSALCTRTLEKYPGQKPSENVDHYLSVFSFSFYRSLHCIVEF